MKKLLLIMSLLLMLALGSFFLPEFISFLLLNNTQNSYVLALSEKLKLEEYYHYQRRHNSYGSSSWLKYTVSLAQKNGKFSVKLAEYYYSKNKIKDTILWYKHAIKLGDKHVSLSLAKIYYSQKNYFAAKTILNNLTSDKHAINIEEPLSLLMDIALIAGDTKAISKLITQLTTSNADHSLLKELNEFKVLANDVNLKKYNSANNLKSHCVASLQFFATNLADLRYTKKLLKDIKSHPIAAYSCFEPVRYIPYKKLNCNHEESDAIVCDESIWQAYKETVQARFIGVLVPKGGAKVHNGIMYLDSYDTADVLAHELAHLYGFIDEYALPKNHSRCTQIQTHPFAHNVVVIPSLYGGSTKDVRNLILAQLPWSKLIDDDTPIMTKSTHGWRVGTPDSHLKKVGLFLSDTCQLSIDLTSKNFTSYKALSEPTSLNYFELKFPSLYEQLLLSNPERFLMPSYHLNIDKALSISY